MAHALINPSIISWAIQRSGLAVSEISKKLKINEQKLYEIEQGTTPIAFGKAREFAKLTNIPFGYLFLSEPPKEEVVQLPDLRTINSQEISQPSHELREVIRINQERVDWYRSYLIKNGFERNHFVGMLADASVETMVEFLQDELTVKRVGTAEDYYRNLVKAIENIRIMVIQDSSLGHHTKPLNVEEFRGFAIADEVAPLIFINTADSLNAQLFTLIHELAHILKGESGISDGSKEAVNPIEIYCNAVTGEFLVPKIEFIEQWRNYTNETEEVIFAQLAQYFHVSRHVIARRALTLSYIDDKQYKMYINNLYKEYLVKKSSSSGGPSYYILKNAKLSSQLSQAVIAETLAGRMLYRDGGQLLGIKPNKLKTFADKAGIKI